ncbi:hypothetical protein ACIO6T_30935 [Streptomyces sp. NPDC087532]|uniref:hypothetical protein n=1 Tax=Streptomyces sp. NPDC087532 TaxID=3365795 RepID=UPI00383058F4
MPLGTPRRPYPIVTTKEPRWTVCADEGWNSLQQGLSSDLASFFARIQAAEWSAERLLTPRIIMPVRSGPTTAWGKTSLADLAAARLTTLDIRYGEKTDGGDRRIWR